MELLSSEIREVSPYSADIPGHGSHFGDVDPWGLRYTNHKREPPHVEIRGGLNHRCAFIYRETGCSVEVVCQCAPWCARAHAYFEYSGIPLMETKATASGKQVFRLRLESHPAAHSLPPRLEHAFPDLQRSPKEVQMPH